MMKNVTTGRLGGFTLIELLVVVLIIGILAAIALPQYEKAVEKSRLATVYPVVKSLVDAEKAYKLANGSYTCDLSQLDISLNFGEPFSEPQCGGQMQGQKNKEWKVGCVQNGNQPFAIRAMRVDGKYPVWLHYSLGPISWLGVTEGWYCAETTQINEANSPCQKLLGIPAEQRVVANWFGRWYKMESM